MRIIKQKNYTLHEKGIATFHTDIIQQATEAFKTGFKASRLKYAKKYVNQFWRRPYER